MKAINLFVHIVAVATICTFASCQKQKLEKLSGTWMHRYKTPPVDVFIDKFDSIKFTCDSFEFKRISSDDVVYTNCGCNYTEDWIKGTYQLKNNILELNGYYLDSVFNNPSVSNDKGPNYHQKFKVCFKNETIVLTKQIFDAKGEEFVWDNTSEIKCQ